MKQLITLFSLLLVTASSLADTIAIVGAKVHTAGSQGTLESATILLRDGKVEKILEESSAISGYQQIDATGKVVTPGLFAAYTALGLEEVSLSAGTVDARSKASEFSKTGAALDVSYAVNPDSSLIDITRIAGITTAATGIMRSETLFHGQGAIISLGDKTAPVIKAKAFINMLASDNGAEKIGSSRAALWPTLRQAFSETLFTQPQPLTPAVHWEGVTSFADVKALKSVLRGNTLLLIDARRASDIRNVIKLKESYSKLQVAVLTATEGWRVADELAKANISVILDPEINLPYAFDELGATMQNAARLHKAGVNVVFGGGMSADVHNTRLLTQHAGNAVANGLPYDAALAAMTINPAKLYGVDDMLGSIEVGKQADLVIWSGDPLEVTETAEQVIISGKPISMESRQTRLRDRYLKLGQSDKPMHYVRPY